MKTRSNVNCVSKLVSVIFLFMLLTLPVSVLAVEKGYVLTRSIWPSPDINVCWENFNQIAAQERQWVINAVARSWESHSNVRFLGWDACPAKFNGIRILADDTGPHVKVLGSLLNNITDGMVLNFVFNNWSTNFCAASAANRRYCIEVIAVHEFGHALGFAHEHNRVDPPAHLNCPDPQGSDGDTTIGAWDLDSVMNYCNPVYNNNGILSAVDIATVQTFYQPNDVLTNGAGIAANSYIDGVNKNIKMGDFNGDGRIDMLHLHPNTDPKYSWVALANSNGTFTFSRALPGASEGSISYIDVSHKNIKMGDFNNDGSTDMLHLHPNADAKYSWVALSNNDGTFTFRASLPGALVETNSYIDTTHKNIKMGDFNGDGNTDMLHLHPNADPKYSWVALSNNDGTFTFRASLPGALVETNSYIDTTHKNIKMGDFNGDGRTDMLHLHPNVDSKYSWVALANLGGTFEFRRALPGASVAAQTYIDTTHKNIKMGDFNGDGSTDMLHLHPNADPKYSWGTLSIQFLWNISN